MATSNTGLSDIVNLINLFRPNGGGTSTTSGGTSTTTNGGGQTETSSTGISDEGLQELIQQALQGSSGAASILPQQHVAGVYNSTTNSLLTNDLIARATAEAAKSRTTTTRTLADNSTKTVAQTAPSTTTTAPSSQLNAGKTALSLGAMQVFSPLLKKATTSVKDKFGSIFDSKDSVAAPTVAAGMDGGGSAALDTSFDFTPALSPGYSPDYSAADSFGSSAPALDFSSDLGSDLAGSIDFGDFGSIAGSADYGSYEDSIKPVEDLTADDFSSGGGFFDSFFANGGRVPKQKSVVIPGKKNFADGGRVGRQNQNSIRTDEGRFLVNRNSVVQGVAPVPAAISNAVSNASTSQSAKPFRGNSESTPGYMQGAGDFGFSPLGAMADNSESQNFVSDPNSAGGKFANFIGGTLGPAAFKAALSATGLPGLGVALAGAGLQKAMGKKPLLERGLEGLDSGLGLGIFGDGNASLSEVADQIPDTELNQTYEHSAGNAINNLDDPAGGYNSGGGVGSSGGGSSNPWDGFDRNGSLVYDPVIDRWYNPGDISDVQDIRDYFHERELGSADYANKSLDLYGRGFKGMAQYYDNNAGGLTDVKGKNSIGNPNFVFTVDKSGNVTGTASNDWGGTTPVSTSSHDSDSDIRDQINSGAAQYGGQYTGPTGSYDPQATDSGIYFKDGGKIPGHDTKGKDNVPANGGDIHLSGGEFIVPTDVVDHLGEDFFNNLINKFHKPV